jgi:hypothetical protein
MATVLVTCSPHKLQYTATQNTLEFGDQCKGVQKVFTIVRRPQCTACRTYYCDTDGKEVEHYRATMRGKHLACFEESQQCALMVCRFNGYKGNCS